MSEKDDENDLSKNIGGSVDIDQTEYENRVIREYSDKIEKDDERKRKENENLLAKTKSEIEKVENVLKSTRDPHVILVQKTHLKQLMMREKGIEKILRRKNIQPKEDVGIVQKEKENSRMISMGILTPFEALSKGQDHSRNQKSRIQRTNLQPKNPPPIKSSFRPRYSKGVNRQNLRNRKNKLNPDLEKKRLRSFKKRKRIPSPKKSESGKIQFRDDGDGDLYNKRLKIHYEESEVPFTLRDANFDFTAFFDPEKDVIFEGGFRLPGKLHKKLFNYQSTCVKWLWQLHQQSVGGILGDEMGLGKTIEIICFLAGLHYSGLFSPSLVVVPATVLSQWVEEFHKWWPYFKCVLLHSSGSYHGYTKDTIKEVADSHNGIIITTYESIRIYTEIYIRHEWGYLILDEGHKIRNPNSDITLAVKRVNTPHRILMSGTPIQNTLKELWSQFDFVFPGLLGTLPVFQTQFGLPICQGQYANASEFQVYTAYRCAKHLRDLIQPYLLRRMKKDVGHQLPKKRERILFCRLSPLQLRLYRQYLRTKEVKDVSERRRDKNTGMVFKVLSILRQICNHPDILIHDENKNDEDDDDEYGAVYKSGKLKIVEEILCLWKKNGNKVLLYSQSLKMLDILEIFIKRKKYEYLRMDGGTSISKRLSLVNNFNDPEQDFFVFLLTTKVGGIGINLTGADRILLFDPDWNPSTDVQALERSWRIGQSREVHVYRLMTAGTIEEKIYHRQIFKQFLTNKILQDPKQKRFFKENRLKDLFQLGKEYDGIVFDSDGQVRGRSTNSISSSSSRRRREENTETSSMFKKSSIGYDMLRNMIRQESKMRKKKEMKNTRDEDIDDDEMEEEEKKKEKRRRRRRRKRKSVSSDQKKKKKKMKSVLKVERVRYDKEEEEEEEKKNGSRQKKKKKKNVGDETSILKKLFDSKSIHNIVDHEIISEGTNSKVLIQKESKKIADEAIRKLKISQQQIRRRPGYQINEPTWTGQKGGGGGKSNNNNRKSYNNMNMFGNVKRSRITPADFEPKRLVDKPLPTFRVIRKKKKKKKQQQQQQQRNIIPPPPPASIQDNQQQQQKRVSINSISNDKKKERGKFGGIQKKGGLGSNEVISRIRSQDNTGNKIEDSVEMIRMIVNFFKEKGYRKLDTKEIVERFSSFVSGEKRFIFRMLLRQAALVVDGKWVLRKEFHQ